MKRRIASNIPESTKLPIIGAKAARMSNGQGDGVASSTLADDQMMPETSNAVLRIAVIISVVFHLGLLTIKFGAPEAISEFFRSNSMEVVLLNHVSEEAPTTPQVLAQGDNAGGGESDDPDLYATAPTDYSPVVADGDSFDEPTIRIHAAREETRRILTQARGYLASLPDIDPSWGQDDPRRVAEEERRQALANSIAAVEQQLNEESARPRRMYIGPAAVSDAKAVYYDSIRRQIEIRGTENFPQYNGQPMYGQLVMEIVVNTEGELVAANVLETSGNSMLDRQAQAIAQNAGPFQSAPSDLLRIERNIEFVFIMRFKFLNDGTIHTEQLERRAAS